MQWKIGEEWGNISRPFPTHSVHERPNASEVHRGVELERVTMTPVELHERLGRRGRFEQAASVGQWNHVVGPGVEKELRHRDPGNLLYGGVPAPSDPAHRYIRKDLLPPPQPRGEPPPQNRAGRRPPTRQIHRH